MIAAGPGALAGGIARPQAADEPLQRGQVAQRRAVAEADDRRPQRQQLAGRVAVQRRVDGEDARRLAQPRPPRQKVDVGQHVAGDGHPVRLSEINHVSHRVSGRVDDAEAGHVVAVAQDPADRVGAGVHQRAEQAREGEARVHRLAPLHDRRVDLVAGQRHAQRPADRGGRATVVRVAVGQRHQRGWPAAQRPQQPAAGPARAGVDEHVLDEVLVDRVGRDALEQPHAGGHGFHQRSSFGRGTVADSVATRSLVPPSAEKCAEFR